MGKNSKPFVRGLTGGYYCWIDGQLKSLKTDKKRIAEGRYRELLKDPRQTRDGSAWTVRQCLDYYLEHSKAEHEPDTYKHRVHTFNRFCNEAKVSALPWNKLTADLVDGWVKAHPKWSISMRRSVISQLLTAFTHCRKRKKIAENPLHGLVRPPIVRRKAVISSEDQERFIGATEGCFHEILTVLRETGARPGELCSARIEQYRDGVITLAEHKTDETGEDRSVYLSKAARSVVERLIGDRTEGPIFRNSHGNAWKPDTLYRRFRVLRKTLGIEKGCFPYAFRHRFASDALNKSDSVNPALVAQLLGHTDLTMLLKHYAHKDPEALKRAIEEATK